MIYLELFLTFLKIGLFSFGGGYGMIPLIKSETLNKGWLTESELSNFIGISESTPGPIAVNMATFVGSSQGGVLGSILATLGVILPAFLIIILIVTILKNLDKNKYFIGAMKGVEPIIVGLITTTGLLMTIKNIYLNFGNFHSVPSISVRALIITVALFLVKFLFGKIVKKKLGAIPLIIMSAVLGIIVL